MKTCSPSTHPHRTISNFFSCFHLHEALAQTERLFTWACKNGYDKKHSPGELLFFVQQLRQLFSAAECLHFSTGRRWRAILDEPMLEQPLPAHHIRTARTSAWQCCPRYLTAAEYLNPYIAFARIAAIRHWEDILQELMEQALGSGSIDGCFTTAEVMEWKEGMMAVVEGAWLVEARNKK